MPDDMTLTELLERITTLSQEDREWLLYRLRAVFCLHCGDDLQFGICYCQRDD